MKNKIWIFQIPIVLLAAAAYILTELGARGDLAGFKGADWLRSTAFPSLRTLSGKTTNLKFHLRGYQEPKNKIVIVEVDGYSLEQYGRWPWHRDLTAKLIDQTFKSGAKAVGLDIVFSEPDVRVPTELSQFLKSKNFLNSTDAFETDFVLKEVIEKYKDRLVLGWADEGFCIPAFP